MTKISKYLLAFASILFGGIIGTQTVLAANMTYEESGYAYERQQFVGDYIHHASDKFLLYYIDGTPAYCIEPNTHYGTPMQEGTWADTGLPDSIKDRITLIAYYGYTYPGHQTLKYRAATQGMIWKAIMGEGSYVNFSTDYWTKGTILDITAEEAEIERLIANHYVRPSFNGQVISATLGETVTLTDTNGVLSDYDISVSGANYDISGNTLSITPTDIGTLTITLTKKMAYTSNYKLFVGDTVQNMIVPGAVDPVKVAVRVNAFGGDIEINKVDSETNGSAQGQATLKGATYGIYKLDGTLVTTITTDSTGYAKSDTILGLETYYLQEISRSEGYYLDNNKYYFDITENKPNVSMTVKEKVVKNYISILKQYDYVDGITTILNAETGINFEIYYPDGRLFDTITTDKNGYATIDMPYGIWRFHQVNTTSGFEKIYDFYITVDYNSALEQYYNVLNNRLSAYLQIEKVDSETGKTIALADTTFRIYNMDTNDYVTQYVGGKVYDTFTTDDTGFVTTYLKLESGNYKLVEISSPNGYLLDENGLTFSIGNNTYFYYTTYGAFIKISFANTPIKGQIEVNKTGEVFIIENGSYYYDETKLGGVQFQIFADEDILTSDGNYIYSYKGDLVDTITTDENGYAISRKLPLGKYFIVEVRTKDGYILNTEEYHFELTEVDNKTAIVYESLSKLNVLKKGTIQILKVDQLNSEPIANTLISIYTMNDELIYTGETDSNGEISINDLALGKYYIVEKKSSDGYVKTDEKYYFELKENEEIIQVEIKNKPIMGTLEFTKEDLDNQNPLSDAYIEIYNSKNELVYSGNTDKTGKIILEEVRYGSYCIYEVKSPEGYVLNTEPICFEITTDGEIVKVNITNRKIKSTIHIYKVDESDKPLSGVTIGIYDLNDNLISTHITDEDGNIEVELEYGSYYYQEISTIEGYVLSEEKVGIQVTIDGEVIETKLVNEKIKSTIHIHKVDENDKPLSGVTIGIYDLDGNLISTHITDEEGNIEVELEYGSYYYQEIESLDGYILNDEKVYFDILENNKDLEYTLINELEEIDIPNTLSETYINMIAGVILLMGASIIVISKRKHK